MLKEWEQWPPIEGERSSGAAIGILMVCAVLAMIVTCVLLLTHSA
jgi:hypothetical protein